MTLVGVDGAKKGFWVVATADPHLSGITLQLTQGLQDLFDSAAAKSAIVVIDVPIGILSGAAAIAGRTCDTDARRTVGPARASSVFPPPVREAFGATTQADASSRNRRACGKGISCQAFGILRRIEAVDSLMKPSLQATVSEGLPEVTFARLNGSPLRASKKTPEGKRERIELLRTVGVQVDVEQERLRLGRGYVSSDDILDALAMLVTAKRITAGTATCLGDSSTDAAGLLMQIWA